jgi:formylglycine-generating enzyme required for sulfatase activity
LGEKRRAAGAEKLSRKLTSIYYDINNRLQEAVDSKKFRIVVFIDDLDRCLPEKAVELLESIKLFLNLEGYLFILGVDRGVVEKGINCHYHFYEQNTVPEPSGTATGRVISPDEYLDKIIQMPLELPPIEPTRKRDFILNLLGQAGAYREFAEIIETGVDDNPRSLTRFVNLLAFTGRLAETIKHSILQEDGPQSEPQERKQLLRDYFTPPFYVKWSVLIFRHPEEYRLIRSNWRHLLDLQEAALSGGKETAADQQQPRAVQVPTSLARVLKMGEPFPDEPWLIQKFVFLAKSIEIPAKSRPSGVLNFRSDTWGEMVRIPRGPFLYGDEKQERSIEEDFYLDRCPVTNEEFKEFIAAGGYEKQEYWSEEGWNWHEKEKISEPRYWGKDEWNQPDHPVVGVSRYEAEAFACWAGKRLPSEEEWEKAARGDTGLVYPWGDEFDPEKCNTGESLLGGTTPVEKYPDGASPYGCLDMAGNVWEWSVGSGKSSVVRGGSWNVNRETARCAFRVRYFPGDRDFVVGFRCARAVK